MLYARKINSCSWFISEYDDSDSISELNTTEHTLSVWKVPDDKSNIDDIALALALTRTKVDELYIVFMNLDQIEQKYKWKVELVPQIGESKYEAMCSEHTNFKIETLWEQGDLAHYIHTLIHDEELQNYTYYSVPRLIDLLWNAIKNNKIEKDSFKSKGGEWWSKIKELQKIRGQL